MRLGRGTALANMLEPSQWVVDYLDRPAEQVGEADAALLLDRLEQALDGLAAATVHLHQRQNSWRSYADPVALDIVDSVLFAQHFRARMTSADWVAYKQFERPGSTERWFELWPPLSASQDDRVGQIYLDKLAGRWIEGGLTAAANLLVEILANIDGSAGQHRG